MNEIPKRIKEFKRQAQLEARQARAAAQAARQNAPTATISQDYIDRYRATISSQKRSSQVASRSTGRMSSSIAEQLGQDTLRAASVIHSSKLNYAAVGAAGLAAVFGITSMGRQRRNAEEEIKSRV